MMGTPVFDTDQREPDAVAMLPLFVQSGGSVRPTAGQETPSPIK